MGFGIAPIAQAQVIEPLQANESVQIKSNQIKSGQAESDQAESLIPESLAPEPAFLAQVPTPPPTPQTPAGEKPFLRVPIVKTQAAYLLEGNDSSARGRVEGRYLFSPHAMVGAVVDLSTGNAFADTRESGLSLTELYFTGSLPSYPQLRLTAGLMDLTSYFDRNSFAKDSLTHFFNSTFQTNPALSATGISSRWGAMLTWNPIDEVDLKAVTFSSTRDLGDFSLDAFAAEVGVKLGKHAILRGTYVSDRDAGEEDGFREIFQLARGNGNRFGLLDGDRERAYGLNAEWFMPEIRLGLFGRYGWYENDGLDRGGSTYSFGANLLDVFMPSDRLGLAYGRQLSNTDLRRDRDEKTPDVLELFYDIKLTPNLRGAVMLQERNAFSETVFGFRVRANFDLLP
ncbi:MAG: carbohydrate porin [Synechococcales bacterium]|nr:carbohydrate porin [Synechococcales bacterium]